MTVSTTTSVTTTIDVTNVPYHRAVAIGAGPANLSLAALFQSATDESIALFDRAPSSRWHSALLHPGVRMQTSWLKDLVSLVDPTHALTFLNYLVSEGRLFALLNSQFDVIPRREYMNYLAWAADRIENIHYDAPVDEVGFAEGEGFVIISGGEAIACGQHLVVGVGTRPSMPAGLATLPADRAFLADDLALHLATHAEADDTDLDAPIAVVGGGQTGIEAVLRLLHTGYTDIRWLGRRQWFQTIDDSPVANDFYRPAHQAYLQTLNRPTRARLVTEQNPTGDALTPGALRTLYQANYDRMLELGRFPVTLLPGRDVTDGVLDEATDTIVLSATTVSGIEEYRVTHAIVAVGRQVSPMPFSADLRERMEVDEDGHLIIEEDYSVRWRGSEDHKIFALNRARFSHGIPDANLTLLPVRAAVVLNAMFEKELFPVQDALCPIKWG